MAVVGLPVPVGVPVAAPLDVPWDAPVAPVRVAPGPPLALLEPVGAAERVAVGALTRRPRGRPISPCGLRETRPFCGDSCGAVEVRARDGVRVAGTGRCRTAVLGAAWWLDGGAWWLDGGAGRGGTAFSGVWTAAVATVPPMAKSVATTASTARDSRLTRRRATLRCRPPERCSRSALCGADRDSSSPNSVCGGCTDRSDRPGRALLLSECRTEVLGLPTRPRPKHCVIKL
jgi:hypothetical protein